MSKLLYVGQGVSDELAKRISENISRYVNGDFLDLEASGDWRIQLSIDADLDELRGLSASGKPEDEIQNSLLVGRALSRLTPSLARENRIWIRLSHIECLEYSRTRWLSPDLDSENLEKKIRKHFFAPNLTGCRDDHAISRLWWNYRIAKQIMPDSPERAMKMILARADIRLNLIERPGVAARPNLVKGIIRALENNQNLLTGESLFRLFMKKVNLAGAGIAFEVWNDQDIDTFMATCIKKAVEHLQHEQERGPQESRKTPNTVLLYS